MQGKCVPEKRTDDLKAGPVIPEPTGRQAAREKEPPQAPLPLQGALPDEAAIFLAKVSHELRTPLTAIAGFADLLRAERNGPLGHARYREYADHIRQSADHALSLLDDLLDPFQVRAGQFSQNFQPADLVAIAEDALSTLRPLAARAKVTLKGDFAPPRPQIMADVRALRQILYNLLTNAIKHSPTGGTVTVSVTQEPAAGELCLSVSDQGEGVDSALLRTLARPADQAALDLSLATGHGMGLRLARSLAEANGARFYIDSAKAAMAPKGAGLGRGAAGTPVTKGTRVSLCFPAEKILQNAARADRS